jgi:large subunit ribosomal protein L18
LYNRKDRKEALTRRHSRVREHISGTSERPRLAVHRSLAHIYAQLIDDATGITLASASSTEKGLGIEYGGNIGAAKLLGKTIAERALAKGIKAVVFDRGGHIYHGRVSAFAEAARNAGLEF